jgi:hypothetical protein
MNGKRRLRRPVLLAAVTLALLIGAGGTWAYAEYAEYLAAPTVDPAQSRALLPVIDRYLTSDQGMIGDDAAADPQTGPDGTTVCAERIIEIRPSGHSLLVGLLATCGDYRSGGGSLVSGESASEAVELTLSPDSGPGTRVTAAAYEPDDVPASWYRAHFSRAGAAEVSRLEMAGSDPDPTAKARAALGLPAAP